MTNNLRPGERLDDLQLGGLELIQNPSKFCFGVDAVFLSDFAKVKPGETVLDMGTGNGIIPVLLAGKTKGKHFTGLEIQAETAEMARRSVAHNHLEDRISIVTGDIKEAAERFKPALPSACASAIGLPAFPASWYPSCSSRRFKVCQNRI